MVDTAGPAASFIPDQGPVDFCAQHDRELQMSCRFSS